MPEVPLLNAIVGGVFIACGAGLLLVGSGRIAGIGGAFGNTLMRDVGDSAWRLWYLLGIVLGGYAASVAYPAFFEMSELDRSLGLVVLSGLVMGFGGRMCNGCTSGHGVCGVARLSVRSLVATGTFFGVTLLSLYICRHILEVF